MARSGFCGICAACFLSLPKAYAAKFNAKILEWGHQSLMAYECDVFNCWIAVAEVIDIKVEIGMVKVVNHVFLDHLVKINHAESMAWRFRVAGYGNLDLESVVVAMPVGIAAFSED